MDPRLPSTYRISRQPVMAWGLNGTELMIVIATGFAVTILGSLIAGPVFGKLHFGLLAGSLLGGGASLASKALIVVHKRQKPDGYYQQLLKRWQRNTLGAGPGIGYQGGWDVLRRGEDR